MDNQIKKLRKKYSTKKKTISTSTSTSKKSKKKTSHVKIDLNCNATTKLCSAAKKAIAKYQDYYENPADHSPESKIIQSKMMKIREYILGHCGVPRGYQCVFTSGATESNCTVIHAIVEAYTDKMQCIPTIVSSSIEHSSIIKCLKRLERRGKIIAKFCRPTLEGYIIPEAIARLIDASTCLVICMYANNETGVINDIRRIGELVHSQSIPMMSDAVQLFGKCKINLQSDNIDILTASFHKFHGPKGCGLLLINDNVIEGYGVEGIISGSQQSGLRGGTESFLLVAAGYAAMKEAFKNRLHKNGKLAKMRQDIIDGLSQTMQRVEISRLQELCLTMTFADAIRVNKPIFCVMGAHEERKSLYLPHCILVAFINPFELPYTHMENYIKVPAEDTFCNIVLRDELENKKIIVGITSACMTETKGASYVLREMDVPSPVLHGVIRVSWCDNTKQSEINSFISTVTKLVFSQIDFSIDRSLRMEKYDK
jgi:cysteine desulfurase